MQQKNIFLKTYTLYEKNYFFCKEIRNRESEKINKETMLRTYVIFKLKYYDRQNQTFRTTTN